MYVGIISKGEENMNILFQNLNDIDNIILKNIIDGNKYIHSYKIFDGNYIDGYLPVGDLNFISKYLNEKYNIRNMNPIEIPKELRKEEYLKRDYKIIKGNDLPKSGRYFIKNVSKLKDFTYCGDIINGNKNDFTINIDKNNLYQLSSEVNIISEYRVFVNNDNIINIVHYDGEYIFPDLNLINKMIIDYSKIEHPKSYTMDIAVINNGTVLLEIHSFVSVGLYTYLWNNSLPYYYRDGLDWYIKYNKEIKI